MILPGKKQVSMTVHKNKKNNIDNELVGGGGGGDVKQLKKTGRRQFSGASVLSASYTDKSENTHFPQQRLSTTD